MELEGYFLSNEEEAALLREMEAEPKSERHLKLLEKARAEASLTGGKSGSPRHEVPVRRAATSVANGKLQPA